MKATKKESEDSWWIVGAYYDVTDSGDTYWQEVQTGMFIRKSDCIEVSDRTELEMADHWQHINLKNLGYNWSHTPPTIQLAIKWLRIRHGIIIIHDFDLESKWFWCVCLKPDEKYIVYRNQETFDNPEDCDSDALNYVLDHLLNR